MIRPLTTVCMLLAGGSGLYLYQTKHRALLLDREITHTVKQTEAARERITALRAEWALLNEPERLADLNTQHLGLRSLAPTQFVALADLPARLPPPLPPGAVILPEPSEEAAAHPEPAAEPVRIATARPAPAPAAATQAAAVPAMPLVRPLRTVHREEPAKPAAPSAPVAAVAPVSLTPSTQVASLTSAAPAFAAPPVAAPPVAAPAVARPPATPQPPVARAPVTLTPFAPTHVAAATPPTHVAAATPLTQVAAPAPPSVVATVVARPASVQPAVARTSVVLAQARPVYGIAAAPALSPVAPGTVGEAVQRASSLGIAHASALAPPTPYNGR